MFKKSCCFAVKEIEHICNSDTAYEQAVGNKDSHREFLLLEKPENKSGLKEICFISNSTRKKGKNPKVRLVRVLIKEDQEDIFRNLNVSKNKKGNMLKSR